MSPTNLKGKITLLLKEMAVQQPFYMIHCWRPLQNSYYGIGISMFNIDFSSFDEVRLLKLTPLNGGKKIVKKNMFKAFLQFQTAIKLRFHDIRRTRGILRRELSGQSLTKPFRHYLQQSYKRLHAVSS